MTDLTPLVQSHESWLGTALIDGLFLVGSYPNHVDRNVIGVIGEMRSAHGAWGIGNTQHSRTWY